MNRIQKAIQVLTGKDKRNASAFNPYYNYANGYGFNASKVVDIETVSGIAAWSRATSILSGVMATSPLHLIKRTGDDREEIYDYPAVPILTDMANKNLDAYSFHDFMMQSVLNHGNGYALINRDGNYRPTSLTIINPQYDQVLIKVYDNTVVYEVKFSAGGNVTVSYEDMYHIKGLSHNGYVGINPIHAHRIQLGATLEAQQYGKNSYEKGFLASGYIKIDGKLDKETKDNLRSSWAKNSLGSANMGTPVLDIGQEYKPLTMNNQDAQYLEDRKFQKTEIATILGVPNHLINEMGDAKYNNVENTNRQFVQYTILNWVRKFENENKKLLRDDQRMDHYWSYDLNELMRGDMQARSEYYNRGIQGGWLKPNEVRNKENMEGGIDEFFIAANNMIPYDKIDDFNNNNGVSDE